jgi:cell division protein ZapE
MDLFFQHLTCEKKQRIHFHRFMQLVHQQLMQITKQADPLTIVAKHWAEKVDVLCFDEFFVTDIGDAMLLKGLFAELFAQGVILVTTSNCHPDQLFTNRLQRERFMPAIELLKQHCAVISVDGEQDHREEKFKQQNLHGKGEYRDYLFPLTVQNQHKFQQIFQQKTKQLAKAGEIEIHHRKLLTCAQHEKLVWFDFFALCSGPRSQLDYIWLADNFNCVMLSSVPAFSGELIPAVFSGIEDCYQRDGVLIRNLRELDDEARRFMALVDELYDRQVQLIISAEVDITQLYQGQELSFEFERCKSRLLEMQTIAYDKLHTEK